MKPFHILIDDQRNLQGMDFIVRTPKSALEFIDHFDTTGHFLYMDNDLKENEAEGNEILRRVLEFGQRPKKVILVTSNYVAADRMRNDLKDYGYTENPNRIEYDY